MVFVAVVAGLVTQPAIAQETAADITISSSLNPSKYGQSVTFSSFVTGYAGVPDGTVTFNDDGTFLTNLAVNAAQVGYPISIGTDHTCAVNNSTGVMCWGNNFRGQLGNGTTTTSNVPVTVSGMFSQARAVAAGQGNHSCALMIDGSVKCWGNNDQGQLGNNTTTNSSVPVDVSGLSSGIKAIALGDFHSCALATGGTVKCWGQNSDGRLGDGSTTRSLTPVDVAGLTDVKSIVGGRTFTCALTNAGAVKCWGTLGSLVNVTTPSDVTVGEAISSITAGINHVCTRTVSGGVKCWGVNQFGSLGDGTTTNRDDPTDVSGLGSGAGVIGIASGQQHVCALFTGGAMKCWGYNFWGQVGNGTTTTPIVTPVDVTAVGAPVAYMAEGGSRHICVVLQTGAVQCWGLNTAGQLGDGTNTSRVTGANVTSLTNILYGEVSYTTAALIVGDHPITANYSGDSRNGPNSAGLIQTVERWETETVVVGQATVRYGTQVDFSVTVTSAGGTPTGFVEVFGPFTDFVLPLVNGSTSFSISTFDAGVHTVTVSYLGGIGNFMKSEGSVDQMVVPARTNLDLQTSVNPSQTGQQVTFTATVTSPDTALVPNGNVKFSGGVPSVRRPLNGSGVATRQTALLPSGTHEMFAVYNGSIGNNNFEASSVEGLVQEVLGKDPTRTVLVATPRRAKPGTPITFAATVSVLPPAMGIPSGSLTFMEGSKQLGAATLTEGKASMTTSGLRLGQHTVTARYAGNATLEASSGSTAVRVDGRKHNKEFNISESPTTTGILSSVAYLPNGEFVVAWQADRGGSGFDIYGQRYSSNGARLGSEFRANTTITRDQTHASVAGLPDGGYVIAWQSERADGSGEAIYAQRYDASGSRAGNEFRVNSRMRPEESMPSVTGLAGGGFAIAWQETGGPDSLQTNGSAVDIVVQCYAASGVKINDSVRANNATRRSQRNASVASLADGGFVAGWQSGDQDSDGFGIYGQRFNEACAPQRGEFRVNAQTTSNQTLPSVGGLGNGGFVFVWQSQGQDSGSTGIYGQRYNGAGGKAGGEFRINSMAANDQWQPRVAGFVDNGFVVAWTSKAQDGSASGIYGQAYDSAGKRADGEFVVNIETARNQWQPAVAASSAGEFVVTWTSLHADGVNANIFGNQFSIGPVLAAPAKSSTRRTAAHP